jgi:hypothetical protein
MGAYIDSFDSDKDFTLTRIDGTATYIKKPQDSVNDNFYDKANEIFGLNITFHKLKKTETTDDN